MLWSETNCVIEDSLDTKVTDYGLEIGGQFAAGKGISSLHPFRLW
jgi:hypothetical protein